MESLPDVGPALGATASVGGGAAAGGSSSFLSPNDSPMQGNASGEAHGVSSASSLTDSQPQQQQSKTTISSSVEQEGVVSEDVGNGRAEDADALIVSAEETTGARHDDDEHDHDEEALQLQSEVDKLRSELEQAQSLVQTANEALVKAKMGPGDEPNDKISHSNFE
eukprot:scaffold74602_cov40-Attheya_sp.AAC.1